MKKRNKIIWCIAGLILLLIVVFGDKIEDGLACLAYYDQCTADRIEGLTKEQCLKRDDVVAFLYTDNVCLVKSQKYKHKIGYTKVEITRYSLTIAQPLTVA